MAGMIDLGIDPLSGLGLPRKKKSKHPPLPSSEQKAIVDEALGMGVGGLQWLGETLDKPGRAARGSLSAIAGGPSGGGLLNLIPFSDTMGLTDPAKSVSGRDLNAMAGLEAPKDAGFWEKLPYDIAGFGTEVATDPTTYLTLGGSALGKGGKVLKALGKTPKGAAKYATLAENLAGSTLPEMVQSGRAAKAQGATLRSLMDQPVGGLFGLGVPGIGSTVPGVAQGPLAQGVGKVLGGLPGNLPLVGGTLGKATEAIGRYGRAAFDKAAGGVIDPLAQKFSTMRHGAREAARRAAMKDWTGLSNSLDDAFQEFGPGMASGPNPVTRGQFEQIVRHTAEGGLNLADPNTPFTPAGSAIEGLSAKIKGGNKDLFRKYLDMGGDSAEIAESETFQHTPRSITPEAAQAIGGVGPGRTTFDSAQGRLGPTKFFHTQVLNTMFKDPDVLKAIDASKDSLDPLKQVLEQKYGKYVENAAELRHPIKTDAAAGQLALPGMIAPAGDVGKMADEMASHLRSRRGVISKLVDTQGDLYSNNLLGDIRKYKTDVHTVNANIHSLHKMAFEHLADDGMELGDLFKRAGLVPEKAMEYFGKTFGPDALLKKVSPEAADAILNVVRKPVDRPIFEAFKSKVDGLVQFYKKNLTLPFPAFHVRNLAGGQWMNGASNLIENPKQAKQYYDSVFDAGKLVKDQRGNREMLNELLIEGVIKPEFGTRDVDVLSGVIDNPIPKDLNYVNPLKGGVARAGVDFLRESVPESLRSLKAGKIGDALQVPYHGMIKKGADAAQQTEFMNRVPMYLYLKKQGWSPSAAAKKVNELQIDYSDIGPVDQWMKRIVPFWTYSRKSIPTMFRQMAERPGGFTAQTVRLSNQGRGEGEFVPNYVGEGLSIPLGKDRYLSEFGLPTDNFNQLGAFGPTTMGTLRRTGQKLLSQTLPPIKAPIELATGRDLFTGRDVEDRYQFPFKQAPLANALLGASPASRYVNTIRTVLDPRKGDSPIAPVKMANLLTGLKITDVSGGVEKQKSYAARAILSELLRGKGGVGQMSDIYVKQGQTLSPEDEKLYRALQGIKQEQKKAGNKKR